MPTHGKNTAAVTVRVMVSINPEDVVAALRTIAGSSAVNNVFTLEDAEQIISLGTVIKQKVQRATHPLPLRKPLTPN